MPDTLAYGTENLPLFTENLKNIMSPTGILVAIHTHPEKDVSLLKRKIGIDKEQTINTGNVTANKGISSEDLFLELKKAKFGLNDLRLNVVAHVPSLSLKEIDIISQGNYKDLKSLTGNGLTTKGAIEFNTKSALETMDSELRKKYVLAYFEMAEAQGWKIKSPVGIQVATHPDAPKLLQQQVREAVQNAVNLTDGLIFEGRKK